MKINLAHRSRVVLPLLCVICLFLLVIQNASAASVGAGVSPSLSTLTFGNVQRGGSYEQSFAVFNLGNSTIDANVTIANGTGMSPSPQTVTIPGLNNKTIKLVFIVPENATDGSHNATVTVRTSIPANMGGATVLPAVAGQVSWTVNGTAPVASSEAASGIQWIIVVGSLAVIGIFAAITVYVILGRRR